MNTIVIDRIDIENIIVSLVENSDKVSKKMKKCSNDLKKEMYEIEYDNLQSIAKKLYYYVQYNNDFKFIITTEV